MILEDRESANVGPMSKRKMILDGMDSNQVLHSKSESTDNYCVPNRSPSEPKSKSDKMVG